MLSMILSEGFDLYPNPVTDLITLRFNRVESHEIRIYSTTGQLILSDTFTGKEYQADLSRLGEGIYFITISSKNLKATKKIVKLL